MRPYGTRSRFFILGGGGLALAALVYGLVVGAWGTAAFFAIAICVLAMSLFFDPRQADRPTAQYVMASLALLALAIVVYVAT